MFATVELFEGLRVITYNQKGEEKIIQENDSSDLEFTRFRNFRPLIREEE